MPFLFCTQPEHIHTICLVCLVIFSFASVLCATIAPKVIALDCKMQLSNVSHSMRGLEMSSFFITPQNLTLYAECFFGLRTMPFLLMTYTSVLLSVVALAELCLAVWLLWTVHYSTTAPGQMSLCVSCESQPLPSLERSTKLSLKSECISSMLLPSLLLVASPYPPAFFELPCMS